MNKHAALGASSAHRWMACPGSVRLSEGIPSETSEYALEGSAAHALAESLLTGKATDPGGSLRVGTEMVEITEEMLQAVQVYVDYVREHTSSNRRIEVRFDLESLDPPGPMFGTADVADYDPDTKTLTVVDYKHGRGVVVEAENNPQLAYYCLGAVVDLGVKPETIRATIVQPRAEHPNGPIRTWEFGWQHLVEFKQELFSCAEAALEPDAPVGPVGEHCRFCKAKPICPAQRSNALVVTQGEFGAETPSLPAPAELTTEQQQEVLDKAPYFEDWIASVREYVKTNLEGGGTFPGWKLVAKRAYRRWADEDEAEHFLVEQLGDAAFKHSLLSPYQAEQAGAEIPDELITKRSSGFNLVHEDNPKPEATPALITAEAFDED